MKNKALYLTFYSFFFITTLVFGQRDSASSAKMSLMNDVVITGTKTFKRKTESPVIVHVMDIKTLNNLQVCNLSEGLKFQPGLRVETNCQTCNYTQLRMNGLQGGYSQILLNGRPIFSPLMSMYGLEQLPTNMIERIEVVRGGGSSLYGSSAIGGTVNVITRIPKKNSYELAGVYNQINTSSADFSLNGNATLINETKNAGISFFIHHRQREFYDANADSLSEIPLLKSTSLGTNFFFKPTDDQKLEISISKIYEYRLGGEISEKPAYLQSQSEERTHHIWMSSADYQINFNLDHTSFISYLAWQNTNRKHYTGILPDSAAELLNHLSNPPYGNSLTNTFQLGIQLNHRLDNFLRGKNVLTFGTEILSDDVLDQIKSYNYKIDQHTINWGTFVQSDWEIFPTLNLLSGVRMDKHNLLKNWMFSPRFALLYKFKTNTQFRISYGVGFRAPQAFDTDMHLAFAGGGISRVQLSPSLMAENSQSISASVNYDKSSTKFIYGFTLEGFYTSLKNAFILSNIGRDSVGEIFQKQNGNNAFVKGLTVEFRFNYNKKIQWESGFTFQQSEFDKEITYIEGISPVKQFIRTPAQYGFASFNFTPTNNFNLNLNYVLTGKMLLPHFGGAVNFKDDKMVESEMFSELNFKMGYTFHIHKLDFDLEIYTGIKNALNQYQSDFDIGKNRDSNYFYGPNQPRTTFIGLKIKSD